MATKIYGIDTNHHHPISDWDKVENWLYEKNNKKNKGFVIVRLGYSNTNGTGGLVLDRIAIDSIKQCNLRGIPVGVYVYSYDKSVNAAKITMECAIDTIKEYNIDYPVVYDVEYEPFNKTAGKDTNTAIVKAAISTIENAGYYGMIYASRDFYKNYLNQSALMNYDKWEAAYVSTDDRTVNNGIWQYTSKGSVPGISGNVDMNLSYKDYKSIIENAELNGKSVNTNHLYDIAVLSASKGDMQTIVNTALHLGLEYNVVMK